MSIRSFAVKDADGGAGYTHDAGWKEHQPSRGGGGSGFRVQSAWCRVQGSGCRVQGAGFRVQGSGCRVQGSGCRVQGAGCRVQGSGCRVQGSGCRVQGAGCRVQGRAPALTIRAIDTFPKIGIFTPWCKSVEWMDRPTESKGATRYIRGLKFMYVVLA